MNKESGKIGLIMLAAGNSRRFGSNKLLYEIDGRPMYRYTLETLAKVQKGLNAVDKETSALGGWQAQLVIVTQYDRIFEDGVRLGAKVIKNPHPEEGISSSVKLGLSACVDCDALLFAVSDQPGLRPETVIKLIQLYEASGKGLAAVSYHGNPGNPCIFSKKYFSELEALTGDKGGKGVLMEHLSDTVLLEMSSGEELEDWDYNHKNLS